MKDATKLLPIGSVVMLEGGKKEVMITGFYIVSASDPNTVYDYSGCLFPEGIVSSEQNLVFNHKQIVNVLYMGYKNDKEREFKKDLQEALQKIESEK